MAHTEVNITGFGKFGSHTDNPTSVLVPKLYESLLSKHGTALALKEYKIIDVSADAVNATIPSLHLATKAGQEGENIQPPKARLVVHFGLDASSSGFSLECRAANEADFGIPDEAGWTPQQERICKEASTPEFLHSSLDLERLCAELQERGFPCEVSEDAGRFVCNYIYFQSLREAEKCKAACPDTCTAVLFVHVPLLETIPFERQLEFLESLMELLLGLCKEMAGGSAAEGSGAESAARTS
uniref:Pyroglutamyl-peptidase I n=1 Tax=Chromera velia CCMP2878 TaxID=1169474 RepID=A0A0G4GGZ7_9ALVE|mmetsp:Transcript_46910/g.92596  ORF Transcript_46910/g.92596 Transcript_46910/m.92596 type:complete len:242 (-) Transcript_46910:224-949(-)|eukprot:Cvel_21862.t1-p1 / transcript=Cvel_21862.t1 / gene=Cvel_21862 / organism=Chromera_velia_CCMP2878 / gene_product=Pyrrolidone-carboxylate peptidase, putative / transcript_product=Pyrrolidone-carboxylate peptidase, putative / location=Cvel_scaffold2089:29931-33096(-) / protein_length=241 / sequence_SO=supercontig / SO=protein_coding / is_pseudo=false